MHQCGCCLGSSAAMGSKWFSFRFQKSFRFDNVNDKVTDRASRARSARWTRLVRLSPPVGWWLLLSGCGWWLLAGGSAVTLCFPLFAQPSAAEADVFNVSLHLLNGLSVVFAPCETHFVRIYIQDRSLKNFALLSAHFLHDGQLFMAMIFALS